MSDNSSYVDHWQEYKLISSKLKKRFSLRKPNVPEASALFGALATRLHEDNCLHYAAFCHLAVARCEHSVGNHVNEKKGLTYAARFFADAETYLKSMYLPCFEELAAATSHCYSHAVRVCCEQKQNEVGGTLCLEYALRLTALGKLGEALNLFKKSSELLCGSVILYTFVLQWIATISVEISDYSAALDAICAHSNVLIARYNFPYALCSRHLVDCELSLALIMFLFPVYKIGDSCMSLNQLACMQPDDKLCPHSIAGSSLNSFIFLRQTFLDPDLRLCLQSLYIAYDRKNRNVATQLLDVMWNSMKSSHKTLLLRIIGRI